MRQWLVLPLGLVALLASSTAATAKQSSAFALLNSGDTSVQCGAKRGGSVASFVYHVAVTNIGLLGAVRVTYADSTFVDYQIPAGGSFSFSQAGGSTKNVDDLITVSGTGGAILVGAISVLLDTGAQPHAALAPNFCATNSP
jgi:hypothetical protein